MLFTPSERIRLLLDAHQIREEDARPQRPAHSFHASSILECWRQQIYDRLGFPKETTDSVARWLRSRDVGNTIHEYYAEKFKDAQVLLSNEETLPANAWDIGGRLDDTLLLQGARVLVDIKTVDDRKFREVPKGDKFRHNYAQLQLYLYLLDLPEGILFYVNRSDNETKEFTIPLDPDAIGQILERAAKMKDWFDRKIIPTAERSYKCRFCAFAGICAADGDDAYQFRGTLVPTMKETV